MHDVNTTQGTASLKGGIIGVPEGRLSVEGAEEPETDLWDEELGIFSVAYPRQGRGAKHSNHVKYFMYIHHKQNACPK